MQKVQNLLKIKLLNDLADIYICLLICMLQFALLIFFGLPDIKFKNKIDDQILINLFN